MSAVTYKIGEKAARACIAALLEFAPWHAKPGLNELLERLDGRGVKVEIDIARHMHSDSQRGYYWLIVGMLAKHLGYSKEGMHEVVLSEFHGSEEVTIGPRVYRKPLGRSHNLDSKAYGELIETAHQVAAFVGYALPEPSEVA